MGVHKQDIFLDICKQDVLFVCVCVSEVGHCHKIEFKTT